MKIEPEDLLACVECMTAAQKASFCELLDPVQSVTAEDYAACAAQLWRSRFGDPNDPENRRLARALVASARAKLEHRLNEAQGAQGVQGPPYVHPGQRRARGPQETTVERNNKLGPGMVGWVLGRWKDDRDAHMGLSRPADEVLEAVPEIELPTPDDPARLQDRWDLARSRWQRTFGESPIPMIRIPLAASATALDTIEGMLYDKAVKNQDPECCPCGCGYVIGCVGY